VAGGHKAAEQATSTVTAGVTGAAHVVEGVTKAAADSVSALPVVPKVAKDGIQAVAGNTNTVVDAVAQSLTHPLDVAKNVSTLASALNPLNIPQNSQVGIPRLPVSIGLYRRIFNLEQTQPSPVGFGSLAALQPKLLGKSLLG
jgi:hypothetical protein